ncbi:hypothetical protein BGX28_009200 [Mortierella sp. GBA30]|nr:hypothetical protein BGX28_009200 [Mortierella sp. GBA30]
MDKPTSPLDIPEIRALIGQYIPRHDLTNCIRVCKTWNESYVHLIWRDLEFKKTYNPWPEPQLEAVQRHSHHVQKLDMDVGTPPWAYRIVYANLKEIIVGPCRDIMELIARNPTISSIDMKYPITSASRHIPGLWKSMARLQNLKTLSSSETPKVEQEDLNYFWQVCLKLESLKWEATVPSTSSLPSATRFNIRQLEMDLNPIALWRFQDQLEICMRSPGLKSLTLQDCESLRQVGERVLNNVKAGYWQNLEELSLLQGFPVTDKVLSGVLSGMRRVVTFAIPGATFGPLSLASLRPSFPHLHRIMLIGPSVTSKVIQEVLASCPRLWDFKATRLSAKDVLEDGRPWACRGMVHFQVHIELIGTAQQRSQQHQLIFKRFSELQKLEILNLDKKSHAKKRSHSLVFQLEDGLETLSQMKRLRSILMDHRMPDLEDLQWMVDHWPELELIQAEDMYVYTSKNKDISKAEFETYDDWYEGAW